MTGLPWVNCLGMDRCALLLQQGYGSGAVQKREGKALEPSRSWDLTALGRKIQSAGRAWAIGDVVMISDGQWAVHQTSHVDRTQDEPTEIRLADSQRVELTLEELARAVGATDPSICDDRPAG